MAWTDKEMEAITSIIQESKDMAWEEAIDIAYAFSPLTKEQRDHLHALNPYKENN